MTKYSRMALVVLATGWALTFGGVAQAQDDNKVAASETFRSAAEAYARGDFETAARSFEVSHRLAPHPNAIYNAGLAWQAARKTPRAADALTEALAMDGLSEEQRSDSEKRLAELTPTLSVVMVIAPEGTRVTVAHVQDEPTPATIHLAPGKHTVLATLTDGRTMSRVVETKEASETSVDFTDSVSPLPSPAPNTGPVPQPDPDPPIGEKPSSERNQGMWISGWVLAGAGIVSGGVAIGLGVAALNARDEFDASMNTDGDARDRAATLRTTTNVMWAAAGVFAVTGTLLLVFSGSDDGDATAVRVAPMPGGAVISGEF